MTSPDLTAVTSTAGGGDAMPEDEVAAALLDAAREQLTAFGIRRLRMDDVAKQAGYGRATLYRRFATRDDLVWAVVARETQSVLDAITAELAEVQGLRDRLVEAFVATVELLRGNVLLRRLIEIEPELVLPHLTTRGAGALEVPRRLVTELLREGKREGQLQGIDVEAAAEMVVRLAHSMLLCPAGPIDLDDGTSLRRFANASLADPIFEWARSRR